MQYIPFTLIQSTDSFIQSDLQVKQIAIQVLCCLRSWQRFQLLQCSRLTRWRKTLSVVPADIHWAWMKMWAKRIEVTPWRRSSTIDWSLGKKAQSDRDITRNRPAGSGDRCSASVVGKAVKRCLQDLCTWSVCWMAKRSCVKFNGITNFQNLSIGGVFRQDDTFTFIHSADAFIQSDLLIWKYKQWDISSGEQYK